MPRLIEQASVIPAAGTNPKRIEEYPERVDIAVCLPAFSPATAHRDE